MESDDEEADQAASVFRRFVWLMVTLFACNKIQQGNRKPVITFVQTAKAESPPPAPPKKKKKKKIYLTFDDGPNKGTSKVLGVIREEKIPVTFFIVGEHVYASKGQHSMWDSLQMTEAIDLCNHSYTHAHNRYEAYYNEPDSVVRDFQRCRDSLALTNNIVRTPGRNCWRIDTIQYTDIRRSRAAVDSLEAAGFTVLGWDLEWHYDHKTYALKNSADELLKQVDSVFSNNKTKTPEHLVLLAHDRAYVTANDSMELHAFIRQLKKKEDYELERVTRYRETKEAE
jgi:peptidoglycan/xylan/chitin deacetylase (PgdA/CDA1 family)